MSATALVRRAFVLAALAGLTACGGGGGSSLPSGNALRPSPAPSSSSSMTSVNMRLTIGGSASASASQAAHRRGAQDVSAGTNGVLVVVYASAALTTAVSQAAVDVSPGSAACNGATTTPRTCVATVPLPSSTASNLGPYWFSITTYGSAPVSGAFSTPAIGTSTIANVTLTAGAADQLNAFVAGIVANASVGNASYTSLPADGSAHDVALLLSPVDASGNPITTGTTPYANPITIALSESGGSGHGGLSLNGAASASSVVLSRASDSAVLHYDGAGSSGYSIALTISTTGTTPQTLTVSPMYVTTSSSQFSAGTLNFFATGQQAAFTITEAGAPGTLTYTAIAGGSCSGAATASAVTGGGASGTATITSGSTGSASCTVTFADSLTTQSSIAVAVSNTATGGSIGVSVPGSITEFTPSIAASSGLVLGSDGNVWYGTNTGSIGEITAGGTVTNHPTASGATPFQLAIGPDINVWFSGDADNIESIAPSGTATQHSVPGHAAGDITGITAGPDGNIWFATNVSNKIGRLTPGGAVTEFAIPQASAGALGITRGPDGRVWFAEAGATNIGAITTNGAITEYVTAGETDRIASGPDGNLWFTETVGGKIGKITTAGALTEYSVSGGPFGICVGPDGNLWFSESTGNKIGKMTTSGAITEYALPTANAGPHEITAGVDGSLWFIEFNTGKIGRITP